MRSATGIAASYPPASGSLTPHGGGRDPKFAHLDYALTASSAVACSTTFCCRCAGTSS